MSKHYSPDMLRIIAIGEKVNVLYSLDMTFPYFVDRVLDRLQGVDRFAEDMLFILTWRQDNLACTWQQNNTTCTFIKAWIGPCNTENCTKHKDLKCCSCGEPATHECEETSGLVCGEYLCDNCDHTTGEDGTNSGKLTEGMKRHCKKSEQVYLPWYMREENESKG